MSFLDNVLSGLAYRLKTLSGVVDVSEAPAPEPGQVLTALDATHAEWADPSGGGGGGGGYVIADALSTGSGDPAEAVDVSGSPIPTAGQVLIAQGADAAAWRDPVWLPLDEFGTSNTVICAIDGDGGLGPVPVYMPPSTVLMRAADGDLFAGEPTDLATLLSGQSLNDSASVPKALFDANTVLTADVDNTPHAITMPPSTVLTRLASGAIKAATVAELQALLGIAPAASGSAPLWQRPASPHIDDDEFTSTPTGWDCRVTVRPGGNQAMTLGTATPNVYATLPNGTGNVVFNTLRPSWMHLQSSPTNIAGNNDPAVYCKPITAPATNMFIWARLATFIPLVGYDSLGWWRLIIAPDNPTGHPDPANWLGVGLGDFSSTRVYHGVKNTSGGETFFPSGAIYNLQTVGAPYEYVAIHKIGTTCHFWLFNDGNIRMHLGSTAPGWAPAWMGFEWKNSGGSTIAPGTPVLAADFIRRIDTAVFPF